MENIKKYLISLSITFLIILILTIFLTIFNYFNIITGTLFKIIKIIIPVISLLISGFILGKKSIKKGYVEGIKLSLIFIFIIFLYNILGFDNKINLSLIIYYIILIISSSIGSMIGINKKITEE